MKNIICISVIILGSLIFSLCCFGQYTEFDGKKTFKLASQQNTFWKQTNISVCWENPKLSDSIERRWVKQAVANTWEKESLLRFTEWCSCQKNKEYGIRIKISDDKDGSRTNYLGHEIYNKPNGMVLNFYFHNWGTGLKDLLKTRQNVVQTIAVHEFGHAIGFSHQQVRPNCYLCNITSDSLKEQILKETKSYNLQEALWFTPCDENSVMNYCNNDYLNQGQLSQYDKDAVRFLYGPFDSKNLIQKYSIEYTSIMLDKSTPTIKLDGAERGHDVNTLDNIAAEQKMKYPNEGTFKDDPHYRKLQKKYGQPMQEQGGRHEYRRVSFNWYFINLYVKCSPSDLKRIKYVTYYLDPSFPQNEYNQFDNEGKYKTSFLAWGSFVVKAKIFFNDSDQPINVEQNLDRIKPFIAAKSDKSKYIMARKGGH